MKRLTERGGRGNCSSVAAVLVAAVLLTACGISPASPTPRATGATPTASGPGTAVVDPGSLWLPPEEQRSDQAVKAWENGRQISFEDTGEPPYAVPAHPDWTEDPFHDRAWLFRYHSLAWLQAPALAYQSTGKQRYRADVLHLLLGWIHANHRSNPASARAWYDHAVAIRTDVMVWLLAGPLHDLPSNQLDRVLTSLAQHGRVLRSYMDQPRFRGHNHNLFHALSLYNLATALPFLTDAGEWKVRARARISQLLGEMVDTGEGVSTEQAAVYHSLALRLFDDAEPFLAKHDSGLTSSELAVLGRMARFGMLITAPDGSLPAIGDTRYGAEQNLDVYRDALTLTADPETEFLLTHGASGERPPDAVVFPRTGWAVMRPSYGDVGPWRDDLQVVMRAGPSERLESHGHQDAMSYTLFAQGLPWLVDSGGPYRYGDPLRSDLQAAWAHNTVIVDGMTYAAGDAAMTAFGDEAGFSYVIAEHAKSVSVLHRRVLLVVKPGTVVAVDFLSPLGRTDVHVFDLLNHLAPGVGVQLSTSEGAPNLLRQGDAAMAAWIFAAYPLQQTVIEGQASPHHLGWVTAAVGKLTPAPVLRAEQSGADGWFVTVLEPAGGDLQLSAPTVDESLSGLLIDLGGGVQLDVPRDGPPTLTNAS